MNLRTDNVRYTHINCSEKLLSTYIILCSKLTNTCIHFTKFPYMCVAYCFNKSYHSTKLDLQCKLSYTWTKCETMSFTELHTTANDQYSSKILLTILASKHCIENLLRLSETQCGQKQGWQKGQFWSYGMDVPKLPKV